MHDPKLIEVMARAMCKAHGTGQCAALCLSHSSNFTRDGACPEAPRIHDTAAALTALCTLRPDVAAVLRGEAVALPKTPTDAQWDHISASLDAHPASLLMERQRRWWPDLVAASPYAQETPDAR